MLGLGRSSPAESQASAAERTWVAGWEYIHYHVFGSQLHYH